jgi:hypothetical protein
MELSVSSCARRVPIMMLCEIFGMERIVHFFWRQ